MGSTSKEIEASVLAPVVKYLYRTGHNEDAIIKICDADEDVVRMIIGTDSGAFYGQLAQSSSEENTSDEWSRREIPEKAGQIWRPFLADDYRMAWREKKLFGMLVNFGRDIRRSFQRIRKGYCDYDLFSIDRWFARIMPSMLQEFKDMQHGCPVVPELGPHMVCPDGDGDNASEMEAWKAVLDRMIFLMRETDEETCSRVNPYESEYCQAQEEFDEKCGLFGEKLLTEQDKQTSKSGKARRIYTMLDVEAYRPICEKYIEEERRIYRYRVECKNKALSLFSGEFEVLTFISQSI